jgi:hypothetical protein
MHYEPLHKADGFNQIALPRGVSTVHCGSLEQVERPALHYIVRVLGVLAHNKAENLFLVEGPKVSNAKLDQHENTIGAIAQLSAKNRCCRSNERLASLTDFLDLLPFCAENLQESRLESKNARFSLVMKSAPKPGFPNEKKVQYLLAGPTQYNR